MKSRHILTFLLTTLMTVASAYGDVQEITDAINKKDYQTAYRKALPLAEKGDVRAMLTIGMFFHEGTGFKQDYVKAMDWYLKAFAQRDGDAFNNIGVMYRDGLGVEKNLEIAYALFYITYWGGLGSDDTQIRNGRNLDKAAARMKPEEIENAVKMTSEYVIAYVEKRGKLSDKEKALKFAKDLPAIKELSDMTSTGEPVKAHEFIYELRIRKGTKFDSSARIDLVTDQGISGTSWNTAKQRLENEYLVMPGSTLIFTETRRALVVRSDGEAAQVFVLPIATEPKPADWTTWKRPSYTETTDATWSFMHDLKKHQRSNQVGTNGFELRYKIEQSQ